MRPVRETQANVLDGNGNEGQPKPKKRRRAPSIAKGGMYFGEKDREMVQWLAAFGWLNLDDLARLMGTTRAAVQKRSDRLAAHQITVKGSGFDGRILHWATEKGFRLAELDGFNSGITPKTQAMEHTRAMVAGVLMLRDMYPTQPVLTERELWATIKSGVLPDRVLKCNPWIADYRTDFQRWQPRFPGGSNHSRKQPDLLLFRQDKDGKPAPPIPVEVELTLKGNISTYKRWLLAYSDAAANGDLAPGVLFLVEEASTMERAMKRVLSRLDRENRDPISGRTPWQQLSLRIESLGDYFISFSRAWGVYVPPCSEDS